MKSVPIAHTLDTDFYSGGKKYRYEGFTDTKIICHEVDCPENKAQFSEFDTVEVDDVEASKILSLMYAVLRRQQFDIKALEIGVDSLKSQGVKPHIFTTHSTNILEMELACALQ